MQPEVLWRTNNRTAPSLVQRERRPQLVHRAGCRLATVVGRFCSSARPEARWPRGRSANAGRCNHSRKADTRYGCRLCLLAPSSLKVALAMLDSLGVLNTPLCTGRSGTPRTLPGCARCHFLWRRGAADLPPSSITLCSSDSRIIVRPPTLVRCRRPCESHA